MYRNTRGLTLAVVAVSVLGAAPAVASASTLFVSHTGTPAAGDRNCATASYSSVQDAINAAHNGDAVYICGSVPYTESVVIQDKGLTLTGDPGATIQAPANAAAPTTYFSAQGLQTPNSVVTVLGSGNDKINGLTIEGPFANAGCGGDDYGVLQLGAGPLQLGSDQVSDIGAADQAGLGGCQYGVAIQIGREYWPNTGGGFNVLDFVGNAQITGTSVSTYQKNGITADGPGTTVQIQSSSIDGGGPTPVIARNGIQISRGATGQVKGSTIDDNEYTGPGGYASATGVLVYGGCGDPVSTGIQIHGNTLDNNDAGVALDNYDPTCSFSTTTPTGNHVDQNQITKSDGETNHSPFADEQGNGYTGYQVGIGDTGDGDHIQSNVITGTPGTGGVDSAFGPLTAPGGPFLAPIDIQTYPPIDATVYHNTFDGQLTNPPY